MKTILFLCEGNISRSPAAMFYLRKRLKDLGKETEYKVTSAGTLDFTAGRDMDPLMKERLDSDKIPYTLHKAHRITIQEARDTDYILAMGPFQVVFLKRLMSHKALDNVHLLYSYAGENRGIEDPNGTGNFPLAYKEIKAGIEGFIKKVILQDKK